MLRFAENSLCKQSISPVDRTAGTVNGTGVDTQGFNEATLVVNVGVHDADTTLDVHVEESDDNTNFTDVTDAAIVQLAAAPAAPPMVGVRLGGGANRKRYVRAVGVVAGTNSVLYSASIILTGGAGPVTNAPAAVLV